MKEVNKAKLIGNIRSSVKFQYIYHIYALNIQYMSSYSYTTVNAHCIFMYCNIFWFTRGNIMKPD